MHDIPIRHLSQTSAEWLLWCCVHLSNKLLIIDSFSFSLLFTFLAFMREAKEDGGGISLVSVLFVGAFAESH